MRCPAFSARHKLALEKSRPRPQRRLPASSAGRGRRHCPLPGGFLCFIGLWPSYGPLSLASLDRPLALSRFLRRATAGACKNRSAAPGCRCPNWRRARGALANLDGCPCSSSAVSAAGSASLTQPLTAPCFCRWQRSLFVPPHAGEPSVPPSNTVNCAVRQSCEQVGLTTA